MPGICARCGKELAAEGQFCNWCGATKTGSSSDVPGDAPALARKGRAVSTPFIVIIILFLAGLLWWALARSAAYSSADNAIEAAASACRAGSQTVLAEKIVEAEQAIRALPAEEWGTYEVKLHNRLKFILCE
jgi:hypothetical protein